MIEGRMKSNVQKGEFWVPKSPKYKVSGELDYEDDSNITLTLFSVIDNSVSESDFFNFKIINIPLIIGYLDNGEGVTLYSVQVSSITFGGPYKLSIRVLLFTGKKFIEKEEDLVFKKVSFSYDHLHKYLGACKRDINFGENNLSHTVSYSSSKDKFNLTNDLTCEISYNYKFSIDFDGNAKFTPETSLFLNSSQETGINEWLHIIEFNIGAFFSILIGKYFCPIEIILYFEYENKRHPFSLKCRYFERKEEFNINKRLAFNRMKPGINSYLSEFYHFYEKYPLVINNYFSLYRIHDNKVFTEYHYLTAIYALESFSRYINEMHYFYHKGTFESKFHKPLKKIINEHFNEEEDKEYKERLLTAIKFTNDRSLRSIIRQILRENEEVIKGIFDFEIQKLANSIVDTRNWLTHFTKEIEPKVAKDFELYDLYKKVRAIFEVCLFKKLGLPDNVIIETIKKTYY